jgi:glycosyltransferase involved in cell wall biosynthesis
MRETKAIERMPVVSIITPTLNAARFIDATLASVAAQGRDDVEQIVVDGGSTDDTRAIVERYPHARFVERAGSRQTAAMNVGAGIARGTFLAFLNADDVLVPGALDTLLSAFTAQPETAVAYGDALHVDANGEPLERYPTRAFDAAALPEKCFICQAATLIRRSSFERAGGFTESLSFSMDYDLWLRMAPWARFVYVDRVVAHARLHRDAKTVAQRAAIFRETFGILRSRTDYVPYTWTYAYADYLLQPGDQVFDPRRRSRLKVVYALALGVWVNRRRPWRGGGGGGGRASAAMAATRWTSMWSSPMTPEGASMAARAPAGRVAPST